MPRSIRKRGTLTEAIPSPDLPAQSQQSNSPARTEQPGPAQATTNGTQPPPSKPKKSSV